VGDHAAGLTVWAQRQISRGRDGRVRLRFHDGERLLLEDLLDDLAARLEQPEGDELRRLFPPAHDDEASEREYRSLVGDSLAHGHASALSTMRSTLAADSLSGDEADAWLRALNELRLVLGTRLDVTEETDYERLDPADPRDRELAIYAYLSWLQEQLVDAVAP
jgi:uncharacterized protein DUF2017